MKKNNKAASAVMAVFPTRESFARFAGDRNNVRAIESFVQYAVRNRIIEKATPRRLEQFIAAHARSSEDCMPSGITTFEELLNKREKLLRFNLSLRSLTDRINALIAESRIELPRVSNPMLTRLKTKPADTGYNQNVLRSLAFWLGHERSDLGPMLNFETLMRLGPENRVMKNQQEGIRIGFSLSSRGDVVDHTIMNWLKKAIKTHIEKNANEPLNGNGQWARVRSHDFTTLYVDFPKESDAGGPVSYRLCLKKAMSLAHQIAIRWALSKYCTKNRFLSIGIVAGEYALLDNYLLLMLSSKLSGDPVIRVSDYVRQCLLINDIKVILCPKPSEMTLFNGEAFSTWWIVAFWSSLYFDFIPELLEEEILRDDASSEKILSQLLRFPEAMSTESIENKSSNAIDTYFKFPHNSLLGMEIAKTLYYRRRFHEALEILRIVLSIDPTDPTARTLRMSILCQLAAVSPSYSVSGKLLKHAEHEARYIQEKCEVQSEDFYFEFAAIYFMKATLTIRYLRKKADAECPDAERLKQSAFEDLEKAEYLFDKAMTVAASAIRSSFALNLVRALQVILKSDEEIFVNPEKPVTCRPEVVRDVTTDTLWQLGIIRPGIPPQDRSDYIEKHMIHRFTIYDDSVSLRSYRASTYFTHAVALWDFSPVRTVSIAKRVLKVLGYALDMAKSIAKEEVCIFSATKTCSEMMPANEFIRHIEKSMQMVTREAGAHLEKRDDREIIEASGGQASLLMTLNF